MVLRFHGCSSLSERTKASKAPLLDEEFQAINGHCERISLLQGQDPYVCIPVRIIIKKEVMGVPHTEREERKGENDVIKYSY